MKSGTKCVFCGTSTDESPTAESARIRCNVKEFGDETFTVWRCAQCRSLHARDPVDLEYYYQKYPVARHEYNRGTKLVLGNRMKRLKRAGLKSGKTLIDYGCGNGHFVRYAREHGVQAEGYDPYSTEFKDASVLDRTYDFVTAQDVLEHMDDPQAFFDELKNYLVPTGCIAIGTPNADVIDLCNSLDLGALHQPYHRHIPSGAELQRMASERGLKIVEFRKNSYSDTRIPFVNMAFITRYVQKSGGFMDVMFDDPMDRGSTSYRTVMKSNPSLFLWGLFGSFSSRKTDMLVVARKPA